MLATPFSRKNRPTYARNETTYTAKDPANPARARHPASKAPFPPPRHRPHRNHSRPRQQNLHIRRPSNSIHLPHPPSQSNIGSIIQLSPTAASRAHILDTERLQHGPKGPLHGSPILLKDNIPTLDDATDTCAGSLALVGARPSREASVLGSLKRAGAVLLGKTNMAEWSGFRSSGGCPGWSARGGAGRGLLWWEGG
ncbi:hypothetical protein LEMA_P047640.1 [Plenodomus lingam JN3]|uniref:Amidase domain-containing protein n=1 Tax=Leptosphaeria maculans (strain JN3 / isolate v23.1.3 / race Av1-4-5-6-7-8) TaxID=985895 RepID=E5R588_LEPMJ|nr:hypothetical protein LEMA_P047640.1 [Plenodomus lingam JN3]CBX92058.1 hypothetical protein LEMA_P047640.1 [Plenodomus lingam JN3]